MIFSITFESTIDKEYSINKKIWVLQKKYKNENKNIESISYKLLENDFIVQQFRE